MGKTEIEVLENTQEPLTKINRVGRGSTSILGIRVPRQLLTCQDHSHFAGVYQEQRGTIEIYVISQHTLGIVAHVHVQIAKDDSNENVRKDAGQQKKLKEIRDIKIHDTQVQQV